MEDASTESPVWTEHLTVRSYDVDATRRMTSVGVCRYFLEAAWNHAERLGMGFAELAAQGKFWVLSRLRIEVAEYPAWGKAVALRTWPRGIKTAFALREFELWDESETRLAAGSSAWLVLDSVSRRPQRLHKLLATIANLNGRPALEHGPEKLSDNDLWEEQSDVGVRYSDIDVNRHVNSARYIAWILDTYARGFHLENSLRIMEVNYLGETVEEEQVAVRTHRIEPGLFAHSLMKRDGTEVCRARLSWRPNDANSPTIG